MSTGMGMSNYPTLTKTSENSVRDNVDGINDVLNTCESLAETIINGIIGNSPKVQQEGNPSPTGIADLTYEALVKSRKLCEKLEQISSQLF